VNWLKGRLKTGVMHAAGQRSDMCRSAIQETIMTKLFMDNLALFLPMTLAGVLLVSEVHCGTRLVRNSVRTCGAIAGLLLALLVVEVLPLLV
jgi:hypothetical protein